MPAAPPHSSKETRASTAGSGHWDSPPGERAPALGQGGRGAPLEAPRKQMFSGFRGLLGGFLRKQGPGEGHDAGNDGGEENLYLLHTECRLCSATYLVVLASVQPQVLTSRHSLPHRRGHGSTKTCRAGPHLQQPARLAPAPAVPGGRFPRPA